MNDDTPAKRTLLLNGSSGSTGLQELLHNFKKLGPRFGLKGASSVASFQELIGPQIQIGLNPKFYKSLTEKINSLNLDKIIFLGGRGTLSILEEIAEHIKTPFGLIPMTVENDLWGCDRAIGFSSALEFAQEFCRQKSSDLLIVEVAGRQNGFLVLESGLALGAQSLVFPENPESVDEIAKKYKKRLQEGRNSYLIVVNEGIRPGRSYDLAEGLRKAHGLNPEVAVIAPMQRRSRVSAEDAILIAKFTAKCCEYLAQEKSGFMVGFAGGKFSAISIKNAAREVKKPSLGLLRLSRELYS